MSVFPPLVFVLTGNHIKFISLALGPGDAAVQTAILVSSWPVRQKTTVELTRKGKVVRYLFCRDARCNTSRALFLCFNNILFLL